MRTLVRSLFLYVSAVAFGLAVLHFSGECAAQANALAWKYSTALPECRGGTEYDLNAVTYAGYWESVMDDHYTTVLDNSILAYELTDAQSCSWGEDHINNNLDAGDKNLLVGHGAVDHTYGTTEWYPQLTDKIGNPQNDCREESSHMCLGDNDAEFIHMLACNSTQWDLISVSGGYEIMHYRLHQMGGFHGTANNMNWNKVDEFASDAWTTADSASWAWIENLTKWNIDGWPSYANDLCAVSLVHGNSQAHATFRKDYEDYGSGYDDPEYPPWTKYHFYCNCDPPGGGNLVCD